ncbi:MAG: corrinoid protein [Oscillospiraceae bacterium]|nr:corrinoid protein [Oscillospiraceae bacterium]
MLLDDICTNLQKGKAKDVKAQVQEALDAGIDPVEILNKGMLEGMNIIGIKFQNNEIYVPDVLIAARAMNAGMELLKPVLNAKGVKADGKVCIGTVKGDLHDIGKNLVRMMMEGAGLEVLDLGVDVSAEKFVSTAKNEGCDIICCSALLTTTMVEMKNVVEAAVAEGIRDKVTIMVGGAPITDKFCKDIGADIYTADAASAAQEAAKVIKAKKKA